MVIVWHYTILSRLKRILESEEIRPATQFVPAGEKPAVWFSLRTDWEPTATKLIEERSGILREATREEMAEEGKVRIGVSRETAPHDWKEFKRLSGISRETARGLYNAAIARGAKPSQWYASFAAVPRSKWLKVEVHNGEQWEPYADI